MDNLAPVALFTYNRLPHTKKTIETLMQNDLASESELFVFSDGAKNDYDKQNVESVRDYLKSVTGFKKISIIESSGNLGLANSIIQGVNQIFEKYDRIIVLEDDLITSPVFLKFINDALSYYKDDQNIWSVTGYRHPIDLPPDYDYDVFLSPRTSSWGWGTWKNSWQNVNWNDEDFSSFLKDRSAQSKFNKGGSDLSPMLKRYIKGEIDSWAIRWSYAHFKNAKMCLFPVRPLVKNTGTDGSGTNFIKGTEKYNADLGNGTFEYSFSSNIKFNEEIQNRINKLVEPSLIRKIINFVKY